MNILVYSVAAESGGALSVLMDFYEQFKKKNENHYYFVVSTPHLEECDNITVLRFPEIKKGWGHRLFFEYVKAPQLVKKYKIDEVFSTTNTILPFVKVKQKLYLHNPLPFTNHKFKWNENHTFWIYQHIIARFIYHSLEKADYIITQTHWMKDAVIQQCDVEVDKIEVQTPPIDDTLVKSYHPAAGKTYFFYPAAGYSYKNHKLILDACEILKARNVSGFEVLLTLDKNGTSYEQEINRIAKEKMLPVKFLGIISREEVFNWYSKSTLLFPSYLETFGFPLLEARLCRAPILASNTPFSREILKDYPYCELFDIQDAERLVDEMAKLIKMNNHNVNRGGTMT